MSVTPPSSPRLPRDAREVLAMVRWLLYAVFVVLGWAVISHLASVLAPILVAVGIAYLLDPVVERMVARGMSRALAATMILLLFLTGLVTLVVVFAPRIAHEIGVFVQAMPGMVDNATAWAQSELGVEIPADWPAYLKSDQVKNFLHDAAGPIRELATYALGGAFQLLGFLAELLLVPVFAYYFLLDWQRMKQHATRLIPPRRRGRILDVLGEIDTVVSSWVRGQATVTALLAILYAAGFSIVGIHLAIPIGLTVGALTVIPFVGTFVGAAIAIGITLLDWQGIEPVLGVAATIGVLHILEAAVLTPKIVGHRVGLSESGALFAVVAGGKLLGFVGVLLAVPIAATVAVLVRHAVRYYERSEFFGDEADAAVTISPAMQVVLPGSAPGGSSTAAAAEAAADAPRDESP